MSIEFSRKSVGEKHARKFDFHLKVILFVFHDYSSRYSSHDDDDGDDDLLASCNAFEHFTEHKIFQSNTTERNFIQSEHLKRSTIKSCQL